MKGLPQYPTGRGFCCLFGFQVMIVNIILIEAHQGGTAEELLSQKEEDLNMFVRAVEANSRNCSDGCSRLCCYEYGNLDHSNYICMAVANNSDFCGAQCKAFVRRVDTADSHIGRTVCTRRTLDDYFKNSSINDSAYLFRVYFGAVDGTTRIYPGADEKCNSMYDPRVRPWYIQSAFVPKVVTVLIDSGLNMHHPITHSLETYLDKAVNTALIFLKTLREGMDYVNIMSFNGDGSLKPPNATSVKYDQSQVYDHISDSLAGIVNGNVVKNPAARDTSNAINTATSQLNSSILIPKKFLKVVIVLTSGLQFQTLPELSISTNSAVNVSVYSFRSPIRTSECNPAVKASSEGIPDARLDNPLYALEAYYSFLAKIHNAFCSDPIDYRF